MSNLGFLKLEKERTGFGNDISKATSSAEALELGGLDWKVGMKKTFYMDGEGNFVPMPGVMATVRDEDGKNLGVVSERYKICQNEDAFRFTDELLGEGVQYDLAGSFRGGRKTWISAHIPEDRIILGDPVHQNLVFMNSFDGTGAVRVLIAPVRIVCSNALNFFIRKATRSWSVTHMGNMEERMKSAQEVLLRTNEYMDALTETCDVLNDKALSDTDVDALIEKVIPFPIVKDGELTRTQRENIMLRRDQLRNVYDRKDDLVDMKKSAYRFMNAVSDYATHSAPRRRTKGYETNLFEKTITGHPMIDQAFRLVI